MKETLIDIFRLIFEYHFLIVILVWLLTYWDDVKMDKRLKKLKASWDRKEEIIIILFNRGMARCFF